MLGGGLSKLFGGSSTPPPSPLPAGPSPEELAAQQEAQRKLEAAQAAAQRGRGYFAQKDWNSAIAAFQEALSYTPYDSVVQRELENAEAAAERERKMAASKAAIQEGMGRLTNELRTEFAEGSSGLDFDGRNAASTDSGGLEFMPFAGDTQSHEVPGKVLGANSVLNDSSIVDLRDAKTLVVDPAKVKATGTVTDAWEPRFVRWEDGKRLPPDFAAPYGVEVAYRGHEEFKKDPELAPHVDQVRRQVNEQEWTGYSEVQSKAYAKLTETINQIQDDPGLTPAEKGRRIDEASAQVRAERDTALRAVHEQAEARFQAEMARLKLQPPPPETTNASPNPVEIDEHPIDHRVLYEQGKDAEQAVTVPPLDKEGEEALAITRSFLDSLDAGVRDGTLKEDEAARLLAQFHFSYTVMEEPHLALSAVFAQEAQNPKLSPEARQVALGYAWLFMNRGAERAGNLREKEREALNQDPLRKLLNSPQAREAGQKAKERLEKESKKSQARPR